MNTQSRSLEWFFRTPSAANFPQSSTSTAVAQLVADYGRLVAAYVATLAAIPDEYHRNSWVKPSEDALKLRNDFEAELSLETLIRLIGVLSDLGGCIKITGNAEYSLKVKSAFRSVLADLVVVAKESGDANFKRKVLELIQQFEQRD